jgi:hypothetical protein
MDDSTKTSGTVVSLYNPNASNLDSPTVDDNAARQIQGTLLTFSDKQYYAGTGKYREEVQLGTRMIVLAIRAGWKRWDGGKVVEFVTQLGGHYPQRHELNYNDEREWACGPGGGPSDPWQDSREVVLVREADYAEFTFCTSSGGGRSAVDALRDSMRSARLLRPGQSPIIELGWRPMNTRFGMKAKPSLTIVSWWRPESPSIAPPDNPAA